jgi:hypothetical protein
MRRIARTTHLVRNTSPRLAGLMHQGHALVTVAGASICTRTHHQSSNHEPCALRHRCVYSPHLKHSRAPEGSPDQALLLQLHSRRLGAHS